MVRKPARRRKVLEDSNEYGQELAVAIHTLAENSRINRENNHVKRP